MVLRFQTGPVVLQCQDSLGSHRVLLPGRAMLVVPFPPRHGPSTAGSSGSGGVSGTRDEAVHLDDIGKGTCQSTVEKSFAF